MSRIDLHMHSVFSLDGEYEPEELIRRCKESGVMTAALTDHNSVRGVKRMMDAGAAMGVRVIPAVELDCSYHGLDLHILGYGIDISLPGFAVNEEDLLNQKRNTSKKEMEILRNMGILFEEEAVMKLARDGIVVGEMIGEAAILDIRNRENPLVTPYLPGGSRSDNPYVNFFWDYCAQGKPAFLPINYMSFYDAVDMIQKAGGIAVIAHPGQTVKRDEGVIEAMVAYGVKGIEVYSSYHTPDERAYYKELSDRYSVIKTMGSDFHGKTKPSVYLGKTYGDEEEEPLLETSMGF